MHDLDQLESQSRQSLSCFLIQISNFEHSK